MAMAMLPSRCLDTLVIHMIRPQLVVLQCLEASAHSIKYMVAQWDGLLRNLSHLQNSLSTRPGFPLRIRSGIRCALSKPWQEGEFSEY